MNTQMTVNTEFSTGFRTHYANTPFEVDEYDENDMAVGSPSLSLNSFDSFLSDRSYLVLDFEDGEISPCDSEIGYGILHPNDEIIMSLETPRQRTFFEDVHSQHSYSDSAESSWYDEDGEEEEEDETDCESPTMSNGGEEDTDTSTSGVQTPASYSPSDIEVDQVEDDEEAAISELRASLARHLPASSSGSAYFEMLVADALSSLDQALRDAPKDCFEELCWDSQTSKTPLEGVQDSKRSRRKSKQYVPQAQMIDVPEEVQPAFDWEWKTSPEAEMYKYSIPSPSQDIGFSPRATSNKTSIQSTTGFKRLARHFRSRA